MARSTVASPAARRAWATSAQADVEATIRRLNDDPSVHGILVQLPLPAHIAEEPVLAAIDPDKLTRYRQD